MNANLKKLFQIGEFNLFDDEIEVFLLKDGEEKTLFISREKFENGSKKIVASIGLLIVLIRWESTTRKQEPCR